MSRPPAVRRPRGWTLAVDFGTSYTVAATESDGRVEVLEIDNSRYLPSTVRLDDDGGLLVGRDAVGEAAGDAARSERLPKRALVAAEHVRLGDRTIATVDLVAAVLSRVADEAVRRRSGRAPDRVVLTHPARWQLGEVELGRLVRAAGIAGLGVPDLVAEPVAAAHHYVGDRSDVPVGAAIGIYDLGGGTFDTAVLRRCDDGFELAGPPGGDVHLGGEDLDAALMDIVAGYAEVVDADRWATLWDASGLGAEHNRALLRDQVVRGKHALSTRGSVNVYVPGFDDLVHVTRGEYEKAIEELLRRSVREMGETIRRAGLTTETLADLYLTGGSSRTPSVTTLLAEELQLMPVMLEDPKAVVAQGALAATPGSVFVDRRGTTSGEPGGGTGGRAPTTVVGRTDDDPDAVAPLVRELVALAAAAGVDEAVRFRPTRGDRLVTAVAEALRAVGARYCPFPGLSPDLAVQILREGRGELGELGVTLDRLDRLAERAEILAGRTRR